MSDPTPRATATERFRQPVSKLQSEPGGVTGVGPTGATWKALNGNASPHYEGVPEGVMDAIAYADHAAAYNCFMRAAFIEVVAGAEAHTAERAMGAYRYATRSLTMMQCTGCSGTFRSVNYGTIRRCATELCEALECYHRVLDAAAKDVLRARQPANTPPDSKFTSPYLWHNMQRSSDIRRAGIDYLKRLHCNWTLPEGVTPMEVFGLSVERLVRLGENAAHASLSHSTDRVFRPPGFEASYCPRCAEAALAMIIPKLKPRGE